jgi:trk system potassium uptake protein TrkA
MAGKKNKKEFAVIGLGRFGSALALTLEENGHRVLGIDQREEIVQHFADYLTQVVMLDSINEEGLEAVDISSFPTVIVAIGTDFESNLLTVAALKSLGVKRVICKTMSKRQQEILLKLGADRVIMPEFEAGQRLAKELINPGVLDQFDLGPGYSIAEIILPAEVCNQSLGKSDLRGRFGINVLLIRRGEELHTAPPADFILLSDDVLVILGRDEDIESFSQLMQDDEL